MGSRTDSSSPSPLGPATRRLGNLGDPVDARRRRYEALVSAGRAAAQQQVREGGSRSIGISTRRGASGPARLQKNHPHHHGEKEEGGDDSAARPQTPSSHDDDDDSDGGTVTTTTTATTPPEPRTPPLQTDGAADLECPNAPRRSTVDRPGQAQQQQQQQQHDANHPPSTPPRQTALPTDTPECPGAPPPAPRPRFRDTPFMYGAGAATAGRGGEGEDMTWLYGEFHYGSEGEESEDDSRHCHQQAAAAAALRGGELTPGAELFGDGWDEIFEDSSFIK